jgi:hypothetical protein
MAKTKQSPAPVELFERDELFSPEEITKRLKLRSPRQVRDWITEGRFPQAAIITLPQGRRIFGWALNDFIESGR